jgi:hypothetical protein
LRLPEPKHIRVAAADARSNRQQYPCRGRGQSDALHGGGPGQVAEIPAAVTLVLSCITRTAAIQVSDRRVTWLRGPHAGGLADDYRNKAVVVCNRMAFAYSGLAEIGASNTDDWLLQVVGKVSLEKVLSAIPPAATAAFQGIQASRQEKRHVFVGVGWGRATIDSPRTTFIATVSNALDREWNLLPEAMPAFGAGVFGLPADQPFLLKSTGQNLSVKEMKRIKRDVRSCLGRKTGPMSIVRVLVAAIRRVASTNGTVGRGLLAVILPEGALSTDFGMTVTFDGTVPDDAPSCWYFPVDADEGIMYTPHFACGGILFKDVQLSTGR